MYSLKTLNIQGYLQTATPNTFFKQEEATDHAALVLPGRGYNCQGPVLHYPTLELLARGADVLCVDYTQRPDFFTLPSSELLQASISDAEAAYRVLMDQSSYQRLTIVGKSLGTMVMGYLLTTLSISLAVQAIWLTPLLRLQLLRAQIEQANRPSFIVIGTADPEYDAELLAEVQKTTQAGVLAIENANHSLEINTNALLSLQAMEQMMQALQEFLQ